MAEVALAWILTEGLEWDVTFDYVNGQRRGEVTQHLPYIPPFRIRTGMQYDFGQGWIGARATGANKKSYIAPNEEKTNGYVLLGAQVGFRVDYGGRHVIILRAENILDAEYRDHLSRIEDRNIPMPGRNFNLAYRFYF